jgi:hypothetical protein
MKLQSYALLNSLEEENPKNKNKRLEKSKVKNKSSCVREK